MKTQPQAMTAEQLEFAMSEISQKARAIVRASIMIADEVDHAESIGMLHQAIETFASSIGLIADLVSTSYGKTMFTDSQEAWLMSPAFFYREDHAAQMSAHAGPVVCAKEAVKACSARKSNANTDGVAT